MRWEPRIKLDDIVVATDAGDQRAVNITISYTLIASGARERLNMTVALQG